MNNSDKRYTAAVAAMIHYDPIINISLSMDLNRATEKCAAMAIAYADALLAKLAETEPKDKIRGEKLETTFVDELTRECIHLQIKALEKSVICLNCKKVWT